jgi:hypothetical protein
MPTDNGLGALVTTLLYSDFTVDSTDGTQTFSRAGLLLPAGAVPVKCQIQVNTPFAGAAAPTMDVGLSASTQFSSAFDCTQSAAKYVQGAPAAAVYSGAQITLKFTPASGQKLKSGSSAGSLTVTVWYFDPS